MTSFLHGEGNPAPLEINAEHGNEDLFDDPTLPCFRASCWALAPGAQKPGGNIGMILFRFSHALMEGVDAALQVVDRDRWRRRRGGLRTGGRRGIGST